MFAMLTQIATAPLTALYGAEKSGVEMKDTVTIHLIGMLMRTR